MSSEYVHFTFHDEVDPIHPGEKEALRLYLTYYGVAAEMYAGSPEIKELQRQLIDDEEFRDNAEDILTVNMQGPVWLDAFFRATAKRALAVSEEASKEVYAGNEKYGLF